MDGYIKLHRKILENPVVCKDADYFAVWIYLLVNATHKEYQSIFKGEKITLQPGQLITGRYAIASQFSISDSKVKRILIGFENDRQIDRQRSNQNSLITILNWDTYQQCDRQDGQPMTDNCPTTDRQLTTNKNVKNERIKDIGHDTDHSQEFFEIFYSAYPRKVSKPMAEKSFKKLNVTEEMLDKMLRAIEIQKQSKQWQTKEYVPHPATWLNQKRWEDETDEPQNGAKLIQTGDNSFKLE